MPRVKLVIFDFEGTVVTNKINGIPIEIQCILEALKTQNIAISIEDIKKFDVGNPLFYFQNYSERNSSKMEKNYIDCLKIKSENWKEKEEIWEITQWLRIHEINVSLVSTLPTLIIYDIMEKLDWKKNEAFDYWTCSELVDEWRPSPIMIKRSMRHCHIRNTSEVVKVSSSPSGLKEGKDAGVFTIALKSDCFREEELMDCNPDAYFQAFKEMLGWLKLKKFV